MFDRLRLSPVRVHVDLENLSSRQSFAACLEALGDAVSVGAVLIHAAR